MTPVELLLSKLPGAKRSGAGWQSRCPAHKDRKPSLSIAEGDDGRALMNCHAGCTPEAIAAAVGLALVDLMPRASIGPHKAASTAKATKVYPTACEAVKALERRHGPRSGLWTYHDAAGEAVGVVVRWDTAAGKDIRPVSRTADGWIVGGMPAPRPLYGLPDLLERPSGARVYVCEGEKAADAARGLGLTATTSPHGSKSAAKADWSVLAGYEVIILSDADDAGERYAQDVAGLLAELTPTPIIKLVRLPGLEADSGADLADFVSLRGGDIDAITAEVEALAEAAPTIEPAEVSDRPTRPGIEPFQPFPVEALPEPAATFVRDSAAAIGCDPSFVALPLLVGFASAIGNRRRIQLKRGWTEPAILWGAVIGESGSTKSPALEMALHPIRDRQRRAMKDHAQAQQAHEMELLRYERELSLWKRSNKGGDPPSAPDHPICDRCWTDDATIEALAKMLQDTPRGLLVVRDELSGWLHFDRYTAGGGKGGEAAK